MVAHLNGAVGPATPFAPPLQMALANWHRITLQLGPAREANLAFAVCLPLPVGVD
jgi:hypothetical protein